MENLKVKVKAMAKNQYQIFVGNDIVYFQSYNKIIARWDDKGVTLSEDYRYSKTTMKYLIQFLNRNSIKEVDKLVKDGVYKVAKEL